MSIKKVLSGVLAAAMVVAAVPAGVAEAKATPTGKALPITFSSQTETTVNFNITDDSVSDKSEEYVLGVDLYYPIASVTEKTKYSMSLNLSVFDAEKGEGCAIGLSEVSFSVAEGVFTFGGVNNVSNYMNGSTVGDYYYIKISGLPIKLTQYAGGAYTKYDSIPSKVIVVPMLTLKGKAASDSKIYIDNVAVKAGATKAFVNNFDSAQKDSADEYIGSVENALNPVKFAAGKLTVKSTKVTVKVKKKVSLGAVADPATKITYKSSNKKVATVNSKGVVKGIKKGKAKITITANGLKQVVTVTVK